MYILVMQIELYHFIIIYSMQTLIFEIFLV